MAPSDDPISIPLIPYNGPVALAEMQKMQLDLRTMVLQNSPEPVGCLESSGTNEKKDSARYSKFGLSSQRNYFSPHWSVEAVEKALEVRNVLILHTRECKCMNNMNFRLF
jgi:hypothetical protein